MNDDFLIQLQQEAKIQQKLYSSRIIPKVFDPLTSFIGENSLIFLVILAVLSAVFIEVSSLL